MDNTVPARFSIGPRSTVRVRKPGDAPHEASRGTSHHWTRWINGRSYGFTFVVMPDGERRYFVRRYNGYLADENGYPTENALRFGCAWSPVHSIIVPAAPDARPVLFAAPGPDWVDELDELTAWPAPDPNPHYRCGTQDATPCPTGEHANSALVDPVLGTGWVTPCQHGHHNCPLCDAPPGAPAPAKEEPRLYELATELTASGHLAGRMHRQGLTPGQVAAVLDPHAELVEELHEIARAIDAALPGRGLVSQHVTLRFYPWGKTDAENVAAIDAIGEALLGKRGEPAKMSNGNYHYEVKGRRGPVEIEAYQAIEAPEKRELVDELAGLRAQVEAARAELAAVKGGSS